MVRDSDQKRAEKARDERRRIEAAAKALRHNAAQDAYAGLAKPDVAYALASILDMVSLRWSEQPDPLKHEILFAADTILGESAPT